MLDHPQPHLSRPPSYRPDYRWPVVVVAAVPTPLVGPSSGRILWVQGSLTFFPPRSETSHRSLYERLSEVPPVEAFGRSPVALFAQLVHRGAAYASKLLGQPQARFPFGYPSQEQNHLRGAQVFLLEERSG